MAETAEMNTPIFEQLCAELRDRHGAAQTSAAPQPPQPTTPPPTR